MANRYLRPTSVNLPPQGGFRYLPQVHIFSAVTSYEDLQLEINAWLIAQNVLPNYLVIENIDFSTTHRANNVVEYSALVHYTSVIPT